MGLVSPRYRILPSQIFGILHLVIVLADFLVGTGQKRKSASFPSFRNSIECLRSLVHFYGATKNIQDFWDIPFFSGVRIERRGF